MAAVVATIVLLAREPDDLAVLTEADPALIAANALLQVLLLFATAFTHRFAITEVSGIRVTAGVWTRLFVMARFLNNVIPQSGNAYRAARLRNEWGVSLTDYLSSYAAFMWLLTSFNFLLASIVVTAQPRPLDIAGVPAALLLSTALVGIVVGPPVLNALWQRVPTLRGRLQWVHGRLEAFLSRSVSAFSHPGVLARGAVLAMLAASLATGVTWTAFRAFGHSLTLAEVLVFYVLIQLSSFIQVTPGNIGLQELAFGLLAGEYGIPVASGVLASALIRVVGLGALLVVAVPMGGLGVVRRWRQRAVRQDQSEQPPGSGG